MAVNKNGGGGYDFRCTDCGFESNGWRTQALARSRGEQHAQEHESGKPMPELANFEKAEGERE